MYTCFKAVRKMTRPTGTAFEMGFTGGSGITNLTKKMFQKY